MNKSTGKPDKPSLHLIKERQHCCQCNTMKLCMDAWLDSELVTAIEEITLDKGTFRAGEAIYQMEDRFKSLFIVQSGLVKVEKILKDGTNHVTGFYFRGELFGLKSIGFARYGYDAIALETTRVCEIPYNKLDQLGLSNPQLQKMLITLLGSKLHKSNNLLFDGRYLTTEKRLLNFLKCLCQCYQMQSRNSNGMLHLPMTKTDIASYLGTRPESISRALSSLQKKGIIRNHLKYIEINNINHSMYETR